MGRYIQDEVANTRPLRKRLTEAYQLKNIHTIRDKKRFTQEALGYLKNISRLNEEELEKLIGYINELPADETQSNLVGWFTVTEEEKGLNKTAMRSLITEAEGAMELAPFNIQVVGYDQRTLNLYGFVSHRFYQANRQAVHQVLSGLQVPNPSPHHESIYTLNERFHVASFRKKIEPPPPKKLRLAKKRVR